MLRGKKERFIKNGVSQKELTDFANERTPMKKSIRGIENDKNNMEQRLEQQRQFGQPS